MDTLNYLYVRGQNEAVAVANRIGAALHDLAEQAGEALGDERAANFIEYLLLVAGALLVAVAVFALFRQVRSKYTQAAGVVGGIDIPAP